MEIVTDLANSFAKEAKGILKEHLLKTILYGSQARIDANEESDIDMFFLTDISKDEEYSYLIQLSDIAFDYEMNYGKHISPVIENINNFNYWKTTLPFFKNIEKEGMVL